MISKHHNYQFDAVSPGGVPEASGDRYFAQDLFRDVLYTWDKIGLILKDLISQVPILLSGGVVTQGAGATLNITSGNGYAALSVQTVDSYGSVPPTTQDEDIEAVRVAWTAQTNLALPLYTPGGATNYVKVRYLESDSSQRARAKKAGTYYYDQEASFEFVVNTVAPTKYDICLASFTEAMGVFTISEYTAHKTIILTTPLINTALHILDTTESTTKDTGSIITEGGIGVEKTLSTGGKVLVADTTDSSSKDTGSIITEGGIGIEKTLVTGGKVLVKDTTESTTKDTGSIITEGGIGVEKKINVGYSLVGRKTCYAISWATTDTQDTVYDAFATFFPEQNEIYNITGGISLSGTVYPTINARRTATALEFLYVDSAGAIQTITATNGSAVNMTTNAKIGL
jgi:hypothetical protein